VNRFVAGIVCGVLTGVLLVSCSPLWGSPRKREGHVEGILVDERGNPVGNARVIAYPADRGFTYAQNSSTDANGSFSIGDLGWGKYAIAAEKESENYASTFDNFYSGSTRPPVVELSRTHPRAHVELRFPSKAGVLILSLTDSRVGKVLFGCAQLERASDSSTWVRFVLNDTNRRILIPADTDVRLRVWSAGYLPWSSSGSKDTVPVEALRLKADEQRVLTIPLAPAPANRSEDDILKEAREMVETGCGWPERVN
jgi:hypothetical protein